MDIERLTKIIDELRGENAFLNSDFIPNEVVRIIDRDILGCTNHQIKILASIIDSKCNEIEKLNKKIEEQNRLIATYNKNFIQCSKVINGGKIAYREDITIDKIKHLIHQDILETK